MNIKKFSSRKEVTEFLSTKGIDTSNWLEEKWQSINKSQAEIHIQALAEAMWDAMNESAPKKLAPGEWHIPFGDKMDEDKISELYYEVVNGDKGFNHESSITETKIKVATARCARLSYMTHDGIIDYEKDIKLHDQLLKDSHLSPFEHCARAMDNDDYFWGYGRLDYGNQICGTADNFNGFIPYRNLIKNKEL